jgi:hypothetical protein
MTPNPLLPQVLISMMLLIAGAGVAAVNDLTFTRAGFLWMLANVASNVCHLLVLRYKVAQQTTLQRRHSELLPFDLKETASSASLPPPPRTCITQAHALDRKLVQIPRAFHCQIAIPTTQCGNRAFSMHAVSRQIPAFLATQQR